MITSRASQQDLLSRKGVLFISEVPVFDVRFNFYYALGLGEIFLADFKEFATP